MNFPRLRRALALLGAAFIASFSTTTAAPVVTIRPASAGQAAALLVDGEPYFIKGITYAGPAKGGDLEADIRAIAALGANTIRNWGTDPVDTPKLLDAAHRHGLKVVLGLWLRHGRPGAEGIDNFNYLTDHAGVEEQYQNTLRQVRAFHQHPAILAWGPGNEVTLNIATDPEKEAYAKFLERVVRGIKEIDTSRPVASMSAWSTDWPWWQKHTPSLDIYAINTYGYGAVAVAGEAKRLGVTQPWMITEFGASGEWEAREDANGVRVEPDDAHKASIIHPGFRDLIESKRDEGCLGGFVFHFGNGFDHTGLWLSLRVDNHTRPQYWATRQAFTGHPADNAVPVVNFFSVRKSPEGHTAGQWVEIAVAFTDAENENCEVSFAGNLRSLPWPEKDEVHRFESKNGLASNRYLVKMPQTPGAWKLYALVTDPARNLGAATTSIVLKPAALSSPTP
jgi:hypothetical protein